MTYSTGRYTETADASEQLRAVIDAALTGHAAWVFVEEHSASGYTTRVWKNLGTANGWGQDWYLGVKFQPGGGTATSFIAAEGWDGAGFIRPCVNPANTYTPSPTYAAVSDSTSYAPTNGTLNPGCFTVTDPVDVTYWVVLTVKGLWVKTSVDSYGAYAGLFDPFFPNHPQEFPLITQEIGNTDSDSGGSVNRRPGVTSSMADAFAVYSYAHSGTCFSTPIGYVPTNDYVMSNGECYGTRWLVDHTNSTGGTHRGLMPDALVFLQDAGVSRGDTMLVDGQTYVCIDDGGTYGIWVNTEAA